jgi:acyl carrier protein
LPPSITIVNLAGEALPLKLVRRAYEQSGVKKVFNLYGPSEDTTYSTCAVLEKCDSRKPVIGRPISNTQVYILDAGLQPVPVGVIGELYLGGAGLARGYLRRPGLTAQRFLPNPFATKPGDRIYRTGDLARYRRDGQLEFLGRVDHQIKLRGFRIEPGEIEAALLADGAVREAVVESRAGGAGGPRLVAYISGSAIDVGRVLEDLRRRLPGYMVPTAVVVMDQLPRSPNGKIERRKLPEPKWSAGEGYAAPRNAVEEVLASIWGELLGAERIGTEDNFVELGGHSLLAAKVVARVRQMLSVDLTLSSVFQYPTVALLAQSVIAHEQKAGQTEKIAKLIRQVEAMSAEDTARLLKNGRRGAPRPAL